MGLPATLPPQEMLDEAARAFYRDALQTLTEAEVPFMLGGAYALTFYTGVVRHTKDLDLFLRNEDLAAARAALEAHGYRSDLTYSHWLAKAFNAGLFVDLIFNLGNGSSPVDDSWLAHARPGETLGLPVRILSPEDMLWSKLFVMDRGRFDGADVHHLIHACGPTLNWRFLLDRAGRHWRVLLSHLIMFGYVYPSEREAVPPWVLREMSGRLRSESYAVPPAEPVCQGTMLSPTQYLVDVTEWGYRDARLPPWGEMTPGQIDDWTEGVRDGK